jgi:hypothetical protein
MSAESIDLSTDNLAGRGDDFYALLMAAHDGLSFKDSAALNARLVLLLANQVGDIDVLDKAVKRAAEMLGQDT